MKDLRQLSMEEITITAKKYQVNSSSKPQTENSLAAALLWALLGIAAITLAFILAISGLTNAFVTHP